ncbi:flavin-containing monooxygenase [Actinomycetospora termitidis]|uniref:NAD(P)/FAD-dependent oxidoreductase n=1 Tax=Actinomycetospora termitidis TaxID=3053470 RepID=A0ABT7MIS1_9PSEU|nr:NAD(P)/FAD-dependent oxidoreductase [Actinomycetospora sp. Odt1-22]MDL5160361.1 NAD(P)/FAD-dependent oxidoreductase [Actinomycetospora sp. Odt1-22]
MDLDVAVVGAGFSGLLALHLLRERGLRVHAFDEAGNVGGTWWWHAYPGSHLDTEGHLYQYLVSEQLYRDWGWSERHPAGYEVQRWFRFVADRLDLRRHVSFGARVVSLAAVDGGWAVRTDDGEVARARHVVACTGRLPREPGVVVDAFGGLVLRTAAWTEDGNDLSGRRVGLLGTTAATIQLAPWIVGKVASLAVVVDAPRDVLARENPVYGWRERDDYRDGFASLREAPPPVGPLVPDRAAMRARLADPQLADLLVPDAGSGRVVLDDGWLELFARPEVTAVPWHDLARVRGEGLELTDGTVHELDVLVVTDEFDAGEPAVGRIAGAQGVHHVVAPPGGGTVSFDLIRQVEAVVEGIPG